MSKFKVTIELDIDFEAFFRDASPDLVKETSRDVLDSYEYEAIGKILSETVSTYRAALHHLKIDAEIAGQISKNFKIEKL
jgi:hypothetical protein